MLRELIKHTNDSHPDKQLLMEAQKHVHELACKINQMDKETSNNVMEQQRVKDIELAVEGVGQVQLFEYIPLKLLSDYSLNY